MLEEFKRPGKRYGKGFYDYPQGGAKRLWSGLTDAFPPAREQPSIEELKRRFCTSSRWRPRAASKRAWSMHRGGRGRRVAAGLGFPAWTGGPLSLIDTVGTSEIRRRVRGHGRALRRRASRRRPGSRSAPREARLSMPADGLDAPGERSPCAASSSSPSMTNFARRCAASFKTRLRRTPRAGASRAIVDRWAFTKAGAQGYLLMWADEKYGGAGIDDFRFEQIVYEENMRHGEPGFYTCSCIPDLVAPYIGKLGNEEQKARWLPACVRGEKILAIAMTEPGSRQRSRGYEEHGPGLRRSLAAQLARRLISRTASSPISSSSRRDRYPSRALWHRPVRRRGGHARFQARSGAAAKWAWTRRTPRSFSSMPCKVPKANVLGRCHQGLWLSRRNSCAASG